VAVERTLVLIKPHAFQRGLTPYILAMLDDPQLRIVGLKLIPCPTEDQVARHYQEHCDRDYYPWLCRQLSGHAIVAIVLEGKQAIQRVREIAGPTKPEEAASSTIRGRFSDDSFALSRQEQRAVNNVVHAASDPEAAKAEIRVWFDPGELLS